MLTKQEMLQDGVAQVLWHIDCPSNMPTWEETKKSKHQQNVMDTKNTLIDAMCILRYLDEVGCVLKVDNIRYVTAHRSGNAFIETVATEPLIGGK